VLEANGHVLFYYPTEGRRLSVDCVLVAYSFYRPTEGRGLSVACALVAFKVNDINNDGYI